ncbi:MAG TPA: TolC family protein [Candidatus Acidoferrales bacterium]|nr:TolC family protein [Candidatus Acidoferrales bacterium]
MNRAGYVVLVSLLGCIASVSEAQSVPGQRTLSLREAVTLAMENSRDLRLAQVEYQVAANAARLDRSAFLPNLYTGAGYVYTHGFPSTPGGGLPAVFELDYSETLFNPLLKGTQRADEERAKSELAAIKETRDNVMVETASTYLELAEVRHLATLMSSDEAGAEKIVQIMQERVAANQALPIDETKAELTLARIRERLLKLQDRDDALTQKIHDLTGIPDGQTIAVETVEPNFASDVPQAKIADLAVQNSAAVQQAENERAARRHLLRGARLSYWPTANVVGQYQVLSDINNYNLYYSRPIPRNNFNFGIELTIPLFASKSRATVALARSQLSEAELALSNQRQQVRLEATQSTRQSRELQASREVARLDLKVAQENADILQTDLDQGKATLADVEQARLQENDKWATFLDADVAWQESELKILQATGQLAKVLQ